MNLIYKLLFTISLSFFIGLTAQSQNVWADVNMNQVAPGRTLDKGYSISEYRTVSLDLSSLRSVLRDAPMEFTPEGRNTPLTVEFPMPNGEMEAFGIVESPIMEPGLSAKYPSIKTFAGRSLTNPANRIRLDYNNESFNAILITTEGTILITPFADDLEDYYIVHRVKDVVYGHDHVGFTCQVSDHGTALNPTELDTNVEPTDTRVLESVDLQTYRYAVATTGEYYNQSGGNDVSVLSTITSVTNQINAVYEVEVAVRLILIEETDNVFYDDPSSDPYDNGVMQGELLSMINANQITMSNSGILGLDKFDIGQVFGTNGGGLAQLGSVCNENGKARSASANNGGQIFYLTVAHETGHQFNATHTFNNCGGNENPPTGFEIASGSTIMGYSGAGGCSNNQVQDDADPYFHGNSVERMYTFTRDADGAGSCAVTVAVGNNTPEVNIPTEGGFNIPISTPFELTAEGSDQDGDEVTYCWEQFNLGPLATLGNPVGTSPLFRSFTPTSNPTRIFPQLTNIIDNETSTREVLPTTTRPLTFRCTVRDNNLEAGGYDFAEIIFNSSDSAGPFLVNSPNAGTENWAVGDNVEVTWDVANTDNATVNCQTVNIKLSMDGGFTYPMTLASGVFNDGSAFVNVPDAVTTNARIKVEAAENIFFDISNADFEISPAVDAGFTVSTTPAALPLVCLPEIVNIVIETSEVLSFENEITFSVDGLPTGATASFSNETVLPGVQTMLEIDLTNVTEEGVFTVNINAEADGVDTEMRTVDLNLVYTDFSALAPLTPNDAGTTVIPTFTWTDIPHADMYELQVSTSPIFDNIVFSITGTENSVVSGTTLEVGTQYFWRIRAINECGEFDFTTPAAFQTESQICNSVTSEDTPLIIPASGLPTVTSSINITDSGDIVDLNLKNIQGSHNGFRDIIFVLTSPNGTVSREFLNDGVACNSSSAFDFGLDDEAANGTDYPCPPVGGESYVPNGTEMLSDFDNLDVNGEWTLAIKVIDDFFQQAGTFTSWTLEYCGSFPAANPFIVTNDLTCVPTLGSRAITGNVLNVDDDDNFPGQLVFTLVAIPQNGNLTLNGTTLAIGDTFTQKNMNDFEVYYDNTNADVGTDNFSFTVVDGNGGFLGTQTFNLEIVEDVDCLTNTTDLNPETDIVLYPNPANEILFVDFKQPVVGQMTANIVDVQGRILASHKFENVAGKININTADLSAGVYFISFQTVNNVFTKKVTIE